MYGYLHARLHTYILKINFPEESLVSGSVVSICRMFYREELIYTQFSSHRSFKLFKINQHERKFLRDPFL